MNRQRAYNRKSMLSKSIQIGLLSTPLCLYLQHRITINAFWKYYRKNIKIFLKWSHQTFIRSLNPTEQGMHIRLSADFSAQILQARKEWHNVIKVLKEENFQLRTLYPQQIHYSELKNFQTSKN